MSKVPGFIYLIKREGENGRIGPIHSAYQFIYDPKFGDKDEADYMINIYKKRGYYEGSKEEYEGFRKAVAGDLDGDGDYDEDDKKIHEKIGKETASQRKHAAASRKRGTLAEPKGAKKKKSSK